MNKIYITFALLLSILMINSACSTDSPENTVEEKDHEEVYKAKITFTAGSLADTAAFSGIMGEGFEVNTSLPVQVVNFNTLADGSMTTTDSALLASNTWYKVEVTFFNHSGANIVSHFIDTQEHRDEHMFFFRTFRWDKSKSSVQQMTTEQLTGEANPVKYLYGDIDSSGKLFTEPVGFVGYVKFDAEKMAKEGNRLVWNIKLYHLTNGVRAKYTSGGKFHPFDDDQQVYGHTDFDQRFIVRTIE